MTVTVSLKSVFFFFKIFGLFPYAVNKSTGGFEPTGKTLAYTKFICLLLVAFQIYVMWFVVVINWNHSPEIFSRVFMMVSLAILLISIFLVFGTIVKYKASLCVWLNTLDELCSILNENNFRKIKKSSFLSMGLTFTFLVTSMVCEFYHPNGDDDDILQYAQITHEYLVIIFYYFILWELKLFIHYFLALTSILHHFYLETNKSLNLDGFKSKKEFRLSHLQDLRLKDFALKDFLDFLHAYFIPQVSLHVFWLFTTTLLTLSATLGVHFTVQLVWGLYFLWQVLMVVALCYVTEREGEKTAYYLNKLYIHSDSVQLKEEIEIFSLQVQHRRIEFSAYDFCKLDLTLLYSMVGSLTSYIIILVQFQEETPGGGICYEKVIKNCSSY